MKEEIIKALSIATNLADTEINLEAPENLEFGDYSSNVAMQRISSKGLMFKGDMKSSRYSPREYAEEIVGILQKDEVLNKVVDKIEVAGPGFINFWLKGAVLMDVLKDINLKKDDYGRNDLLAGKKVVVEYTDPNPFKEFHIGHLISNVTGESFARLQEVCGATVWRADYFGDVGVHVAKSIWGIRNKMEAEKCTLDALSKLNLNARISFMGQGYALGTRAFDEDEKAKEEIGRLNTVIYKAAQRMWAKEGMKSEINYDAEEKVPDSEVDGIYDLYEKGRSWSLEYFETIYMRLGTKFDGYYPESKVGEVGYKLVKDNIGRVFEESEGAVIFRGEKFGLHTRVFINKHNLPTYEAKELGLAPAKYSDFAYDKSIIVVGKEIKEYFAVLVEALKQVNSSLGNATYPICTGMVNLPEGKMSSRRGNVVTVTGILDDLKRMIGEKMKEGYSDVERSEIGENVAVGALKYAFLKNSVGSDFVFDMTTALSLEGNSGPYLQYTAARASSVLRKTEFSISNFQFSKDLELNASELSVARYLVHFPETVDSAAKTYSPNVICNYLYELAQRYNNFYNSNRILEDKNETFRLALTAATGQVIKNGLYLLGISAPERM
jgi:arginyl-tRNA synthetase